MKPFHFKKFSIQQSKEVFRVGTDGVLLGALASIKGCKTILEVGTGTGLISMMLAQRNKEVKILGIDINENAVHLATENFENTPFHQRLEVVLKDFKFFTATEKIDLIVSNPPYFEINSSEKDDIARQQKELTFENLISKSASLLSHKGILSVIIPAESEDQFIAACKRHGLSLHHKVIIHGILKSKPQRLILEFGFEEREIKTTELTVEKLPRVYTDEYLELTKDFHQFQK